MADLQRLAALVYGERHGKLSAEQKAALAELRLRAKRKEQTLSQYIAPLVTIGTASVADPISGIAGIAGSVLPGEQGQGSRWVEGVQEALTVTPRDEAGQRGLQAVGEFVQPITQSIQGAEQAMGDYGYEKLGPLGGAIGTSIPTAMMEGLGLKGIRGFKNLDNADLGTMRMGVGPIPDMPSPAPSNNVAGYSRSGIDLFHGTDEAGYSGIMGEGVIRGPAYFSPRKDIAEEYSMGHIIEASIDPENLKVDLDLGGGRLMTVEEANRYLDNIDEWTIEDFIDNGYSVGTDSDVDIRPVPKIADDVMPPMTRQAFEESAGDMDVYYHTSPQSIGAIEERPQFGSNLFFSSSPYYMGEGGSLYGMKLRPDDVVEATSIPFLDLSDDSRKIYDAAVARYAERIGTDDLDLAEDLLTERKDLSDYVDELAIDYDDFGDVSWEGQRILGDLGRDLGYKGVLGTDEQGSVLIAPMLGRDKELVPLIDE